MKFIFPRYITLYIITLDTYLTHEILYPLNNNKKKTEISGMYSLFFGEKMEIRFPGEEINAQKQHNTIMHCDYNHLVYSRSYM